MIKLSRGHSNMTASIINPASVAAMALRAVKSASDYTRLGDTTAPDVLSEAWDKLSEVEQERITAIVNDDRPVNPKVVADELAACGSLTQLQETKATYGDALVKIAWKILPTEERDRLTLLCKPQQLKKEVQPMNPNITQVEKPQPKRTLFTIGDDLEHLTELLDNAGDDAEQLTLINEWFETLGTERDTKLDNYASLISEMQGRAAIRKAEAQRMSELAASDELRAKQLKDRLKTFFEQHDIKKIDTQRYRLSLCNNSTRPLVINPDTSPTDLPEPFQKVSVEANTTAIREALKAGTELSFAHLGEAGKHIRIK